MTFRHDMPLGAAVLEDGTTRFRLRAPAARQADLVLGASGANRDCATRREHVVPRLARLAVGGRHAVQPPGLMRIVWAFDGDEEMHLLANLGDDAASGVLPPPGRPFHAHGTTAALLHASGRLAPWSVVWTIVP